MRRVGGYAEFGAEAEHHRNGGGSFLAMLFVGINNKDEKRTFCTKVLEQHVTVWLVRCAKYCEDAGGIDK